MRDGGVRRSVHAIQILEWRFASTIVKATDFPSSRRSRSPQNSREERSLLCRQPSL
jgi:hypothetical protein